MSYILGGDSYESIYPHWDGDKQELDDKCNKRLHDIYGNNPPEWAVRRLNAELSKICEYNFSGFYLMMQDLIDKLGVMPHEFFTRGTAGNSFVAFLLGISGEINPLPAHYRCSDRHYSEISDDPAAKFGCELPEKNCPICGKNLIRDGFSLHQYMFTTDKGDVCPNFELNLPKKYTEKPLEWMSSLRGIAASVPILNDIYLDGEFTKEITGYVLIPDYAVTSPKVKDFLDKYSGKRITSREYYDGYDELPKVSILYHPYCETLKTMAESKNVDVTTISLSDQKVKDMLNKIDSLSIQKLALLMPPYTYKEESSNTIPHGITMMKKLGVSTFSDAVKAFGLMHGTDVYNGNARELILDGVASLNEIISDRDDIMYNCMDHGMDEVTSFKISDRVRKGKGLTEDLEGIMLKYGFPKWYIESCNKVKYLFPKAHSIGYVLQMWRILYLM